MGGVERHDGLWFEQGRVRVRLVPGCNKTAESVVQIHGKECIPRVQPTSLDAGWHLGPSGEGWCGVVWCGVAWCSAV